MLTTCTVARFVSLAVVLVLIPSCPRRADSPRLADANQAHYPWDMPGWRQESQQNPTGVAEDIPIVPATGGSVAIPNDKGRHPALDPLDTFDRSLLPGEWLIVAHVDDERVVLRSPDNFSVTKFFESGTLTLQPVIGGQLQQADNGTWEKSAPGVLLMALGTNTPQTFYCQFSGRDFLYMWTFEQANGLWLVRRPEQFAERISNNDLTFTSGERLHLTSVKGSAFDGTISGPIEYEVHGSYSQGVLNMRWIDRADNVDGFAVFRVSPDWKQLDGVWWLNNYEAAPFGGRWQTAMSIDPSSAGAE
jgi:hypothetical protein